MENKEQEQAQVQNNSEIIDINTTNQDEIVDPNPSIPQGATIDSQPDLKTKKHKFKFNKKKLIIMGLAILVILASGGASAYFIIQNASKDPGESNNNATVVAESNTNTFEYLNAKYNSDSISINNGKSSIAQSFKPDYKDYSVSIKGDSLDVISIHFSDEPEAEDVMSQFEVISDDILSFWTNLGFSAYSENTNGLMYKQNDTICRIDKPIEYVSDFYSSCYDFSSLQNTVVEIDPFVAAYNADYSSFLSFVRPSIAQSAAPGYRIASLQIDEGRPDTTGGVYFYDKNDGKWQYLASSQQDSTQVGLISCKTIDIQEDRITVLRAESWCMNQDTESNSTSYKTIADASSSFTISYPSSIFGDATTYLSRCSAYISSVNFTKQGMTYADMSILVSSSDSIQRLLSDEEYRSECFSGPIVNPFVFDKIKLLFDSESNPTKDYTFTKYYGDFGFIEPIIIGSRTWYSTYGTDESGLSHTYATIIGDKMVDVRFYAESREGNNSAAHVEERNILSQISIEAQK